MPQTTIIVLCSLGGNTLRAARVFARGLQDADASARVRVLEPALPLDPATRRAVLTPSAQECASARDAEIAASVAASTGLAVLTPVFAYDVPPGAVAWLRTVLPALDGRACVALCTYGTIAGAAPAVLAHTLASLGGRVVTARALQMPDTFAWFLPRAQGTKHPALRWPAATHAACRDAGAHLAHVLETAGCEGGGKDPHWCAPPREVQGPTLAARVLAAMPYACTRAMAGAVHIDARVCIGCGACTQRCPTGALRLTVRSGGRAVLSADGNDDSLDTEKRKGTTMTPPLWESARCIGCAQCAGACPQGAVTLACVDARGAAVPARRGVGRVPHETVPGALGVGEEQELAAACLDATGWRAQRAAEWARFFCATASHPLAAIRAVWAFIIGVITTVLLGVRPFKSTPLVEKEEKEKKVKKDEHQE